MRDNAILGKSMAFVLRLIKNVENDFDISYYNKNKNAIVMRVK